jgi:hypothetical protein
MPCRCEVVSAKINDDRPIITDGYPVSRTISRVERCARTGVDVGVMRGTVRRTSKAMSVCVKALTQTDGEKKIPDKQQRRNP